RLRRRHPGISPGAVQRNRSRAQKNPGVLRRQQQLVARELWRHRSRGEKNGTAGAGLGHQIVGRIEDRSEHGAKRARHGHFSDRRRSVRERVGFPLRERPRQEIADHVQRRILGDSRRARRLRAELSGHGPARRRVDRPDPQRRRAGGAAHRARNQIRSHAQLPRRHVHRLSFRAGAAETSGQSHPLIATMEQHLAETIRSIPIFSGLSREDVAKILGKMEETVLHAGATIFSQGDQGDAFYLIQSGAVQVLLESGADKSEVVAILGPRDWFGEMALLSGEPRAVKETSLWRLRREDWDELIDKHPTWLLQFCATLSKRLSYVDRQYSTGREAFNSLAEEFYNLRSPAEQAFFREVSLLGPVDKNLLGQLFPKDAPIHLMAEFGDSQFPLIRRLDDGKYELHSFFRDFLHEKLLDVDGLEAKQRLHARFAERYEALGELQEAIHHT